MTGIPVPANSPLDGTMHVCQFSEDWLPIVTGALNDLLIVSQWDSPPADIIPQVNELMRLIEETVTIPPQVFRSHFSIIWRAVKVGVGNPLAFALNTAFSLNGTWSQTAAAQNDVMTFDALLVKGTYTLHAQGTKTNASGIASWYLHSTLIGQLDWYVGSGATETIQTFTFTLADDSLCVFQAKMATKNSSSSGYRHALNLVWID